MREKLKQAIAKSAVIRAVIVFLAVYAILTVLWIKAKDIYGYGITFVASKVVETAKGAPLENLLTEKDVVVAIFGTPGTANHVQIAVPVKVSLFSTNVPLVLSLLISIFPFIRRRIKAYSAAVSTLLLFHLVHVSLFETLQLSSTFMSRGIEQPSSFRLSVYQFLWGITEHASMGFAPFLIVFIIFISFRNMPIMRGR